MGFRVLGTLRLPFKSAKKRITLFAVGRVKKLLKYSAP